MSSASSLLVAQNSTTIASPPHERTLAVPATLTLGTHQLQRLGRELKCPICLCLFRQAASLSCNHIFCNSCIFQSMQRFPACPTCKIPATRREVRAAPQMDSLVNIYKSMEITAGIDLFASQNATLKIAGDAPLGSQRKRKGCQHQEPLLNVLDQVMEAKNSTDIIASPVDSVHQFQASLPSKKRVQVPRFASIRDEIEFYEGNAKDVDVPLFRKKDSICTKRNQGNLRAESVDSKREGNHMIKASDASVAAGSRENNELLAIKDASQKQTEDLELNCKAGGLQKSQSEKDTTTLPFSEGKYDIVADVLDVDDFRRPKVSAFFWLRENSVDIDDTQTQVQPPELTQTQPNLQTSFSDWKDLDDDCVEHEKEVTKGASAEVNGKILEGGLPIDNGQGERVPPTKSHKRDPSQIFSFPPKSTVANDPEAVQTLKEDLELVRHRPESTSRRSSTRLKPASIDLNGGTTKDEYGAVADGGQQKSCSVLQSQNQNQQNRRMTKQGLKKDCTVNSKLDQALTSSNYNENGSKEGSLTASMIFDVMFGNGEKATPAICETVAPAKEITCCTGGQSSSSPLCEQGDDPPEEKPAACVFCGSSGDSELAGSMIHYKDGTQVERETCTSTDIVAVHKLCAEWAPAVYFVDGIVKNLPAEVARGQKIKCSKCGMKGAVLGCCLKRCRKSFHYPCARAMSCRWDEDNFIILCPDHTTRRFPQELGRKCPEREPVPTTTRDPRDVATTATIDETEKVSQKCLPGPASEWVLCGSALNSNEKEQLASFAAQTGATLIKDWNSNVTHLIAGTSKDGAARRTFKFLMATMEGKWILKVGWVTACIGAGSPVSEEPYEISLDIHGMADGPKRGRFAAKAPKLFEGTEFFFLGDYVPSYKADLQALVVAAGGSILHRRPVIAEAADGSMTEIRAIIIYSKDFPFNGGGMEDRERIIDKRKSEAVCLATSVGAHVAAHTWILDSIAACELQAFE